MPPAPDNELSDLLARARSAQRRMDTARAELAFETRLQQVLLPGSRDAGPAGRFHTWLRAAIGLASATGVVAFLFLTGRPAAELDDTLTAWWTDSAAAWDAQLFD